MDIAKALITAVQAGGPEGLKKLRTMGVTSEWLTGDARKLYEFILEFQTEYSALPSDAVVQHKTGIVLEKPDAPLDFYLEEFLKQRMEVNLLRGVKDAAKLLETSPSKALEQLKNLVVQIQKEALVNAASEPLGNSVDEALDYFTRVEAGYRGVPTPWASVNDQTMGWWPEDLVLWVARLGVGKCLDGSTLISNPDTGAQTAIKEMVESGNGKQILTWAPNRGISAAPITARVSSGRKECFRVTTVSGREVVGSADHPLLTATGWVKIADLTAGDTIAAASRIPSPKKARRLPTEHVDLLALLYSEGTCTRPAGVGFTSGEPEIIQIAERAARTAGGEYGFDFTGPAGVKRGRYEHSNPILNLMRHYGLEGVLAKNKTLCPAVFRLPSDQLARLLSIFWMCDGYSDGGGPGITLASKAMVYQLQHLLLRFGVQSRVRYKKARCQGKTFDAWRLTVNADSYAAFGKQIALWGYKKTNLDRHTARARNPNVGYPRAWPGFMARIKEIVRANPNKQIMDVGNRLGWKSYFSTRNLVSGQGNISLRALKVFCESYGCTDEFKALWADVYWDAIRAIEPVGERETYDFTVSPTSCFVANDLVVHNSFALILMAQAAIAANKRVLFLTTEMSRVKITLRWLALSSRIPYSGVVSGKLAWNERARLFEAGAALKELQIMRVVGGDFDFQTKYLGGAIEDANPDVVFIDGAYLLRSNGKDRIEKAANTFDELKRIATRMKMPIVCTTQFNREVKKESVDSISIASVALTDVAGWNATCAFALHRDDSMKDFNQMDIIPLKLREGKERKVPINWDIDRCNFTEREEAATTVAPGLPPTGGHGDGGEEHNF